MSFFGDWNSGAIWRSILRLDQQHGHIDFVPHGVGGGAEKQVGQQAVAVRAHGDQIAAPLADPANDLRRRIAKASSASVGTPWATSSALTCAKYARSSSI